MRINVEGPAGERSIPVLIRAGTRAHLIGIGGSGMSGVAKMLVDFGATVSGSDLTSFPGLGDLVSLGVRIEIGHDEGNLSPDTDLVVISAAIPTSNPELTAAVARGLPVIKYAKLLGALMAHRNGVAIAGTHGKTTTTAICAHLLKCGGLSPSFIFGAHSDQLGGSSGVGSGPHFVVESCEFDRSFLYLEPRSAAILNVEPDHLDCYRDLDDIVDAFSRFAGNVAVDGLVVCNGDDPQAMQAVSRAKASVQTFGFKPDADWQALNLVRRSGLYAFDVAYRRGPVCSVQLAVPGLHNVGNALAAAALAAHAGVDPRSIGEGLSTFAGVKRRMSWRGKGRGVNIVDDYAHHPTEVRATIEAARSRYQPRRTWVVFQPHQHARTRYFLDEFASSFGGVDEIIIPDIFGAREAGAGDHAIDAEELVSRIRQNGGRARYVETLEAAAEHVARNVTAGDLVVTMGAGDVWKVADELVARIC